MDVSKKYTEGLTKKQKTELSKNIKQTNQLLKEGKDKEAFKLAEKRPQPKKTPTPKTSSFTDKLKKIYGVEKIPNTPSKEFTTLTGLPTADQKTILDRGMGAFLTSGSRRNTTATAWSRARLYAFVVKSVDAIKQNKKTINQDNLIFDKVKGKIKLK